MLTKASHLPVVDGEGNLVGLIAKIKVSQEAADTSGKTSEYETIPDFLLEKTLNESVLNYFKDNPRIPVLNSTGERIGLWDKPRFLAEFSKLEPKPKKETKVEELLSQKDKARQSKEPIQWYMELILANFPDGLYSSDLMGSTLFYNEAFETKFLTLPIFKNSLAIAERVLKELNRDLMAKHLTENEMEVKALSGKINLQSYWKEADCQVRITSLEKEDKIAGFLYHLTKGASQQGSSPTQGLWDEESLERKPLQKILEEVEASYVMSALKKNKFNISHTAKALEMPRTTLQNRIRFLKIKVPSELTKEIPAPATQPMSKKVSKQARTEAPTAPVKKSRKPEVFDSGKKSKPRKPIPKPAKKIKKRP